MENVLAVGENPDELIVYAALGRAARNWASHDAIVATLKTMAEDETLLIQSGKPIGVVKTHVNAPLVIMANCNMVGQWAKAEVFYDLQDKGLICWGGLTAGAWQYIGSQGVIQGTFEIFMQIARQHFHDSLAGKFILTAGLGGMGGAQPLAGVMAGAAKRFPSASAATPPTFTRNWWRAASPRTSSPTKPRRTIWSMATSPPGWRWRRCATGAKPARRS